MEYKQLELTQEQSKNEDGVTDIGDAYFDITLVINRDHHLRVYNTKEDGNWRGEVDSNTIIVKELKLRI